MMSGASTLPAIVIAHALLGLSVALAHVAWRCWLQDNELLVQPLIASLQAICVAALVSWAVALIKLQGGSSIVMLLGAAAYIGLIVLVWLRSAKGRIWKAIRGNPQSLWMLGIQSRTSANHAFLLSIMAAMGAGWMLADLTPMDIGGWATLVASFALAVWVSFWLPLVIGPLLAIIADFLPVSSAMPLAGLGMILLLALVGMSRVDNELA